MRSTDYREALTRRQELTAFLRRTLTDRGILEIDASCLDDDCVIDPYIDPIAVGDRFLQTSPEAVMKRMLAAGSGSIFSLGPVFRDGEHGRQHRTEFTMLEWYEVDATDEDIWRTVDAMTTRFGQRTCERISYRDLFRRTVDVDPIDGSIRQLRRAVPDADLADRLKDDRDGLCDAVMSLSIQPTLIGPTIVHDYPLSQAALARPSTRDPQCAARFEWFVGGVELGNGYDELTDADELVRRGEAANRRRVESGRFPLPPPERLIDAMRRGLPPCAGMAVGVERMMIAAGDGPVWPGSPE